MKKKCEEEAINFPKKNPGIYSIITILIVFN